MLPSDPKGNCRDNKDRKRSKWNYNSPRSQRPLLRPEEGQGRRAGPFSSRLRVPRPVHRWCAPAAGSPVPRGSLPPPVVFQSLSRSSSVPSHALFKIFPAQA